MEEFVLEDGEHVVIAVRQHMFVLLLKLLPFAVLMFAPSLVRGLFSILASMNPEATTAIAGVNLSGSLSRFLYGAFLLFLWIGAFTTFTRYYLTVWIITNIRIVDIKQRSFFSREVSSFLLIRVQDITTQIYGLFPTLIGYGHLNVETAGNIEKFCMDGISRPTHVRDIIMSQVADLHDQNGVKSGV